MRDPANPFLLVVPSTDYPNHDGILQRDFELVEKGLTLSEYQLFAVEQWWVRVQLCAMARRSLNALRRLPSRTRTGWVTYARQGRRPLEEHLYDSRAHPGSLSQGAATVFRRL